MKKFPLVSALISCLFSPLALGAAQIPYGGELSFSVRTNLAAISFEGQVGQSPLASLEDQKVRLSLSPENFQTGMGLRDDHLREQILKSTPLLFEAPFDCEMTASSCTLKGELKIGDKTSAVEVPITLAEQGQRVQGEFNLSLKEMGLEAPSYMGVTVKDRVVVRFDLRRQ